MKSGFTKADLAEFLTVNNDDVKSTDAEDWQRGYYLMNFMQMILPGSSGVVLLFCAALYACYLFIYYNSRILAAIGRGIKKIRGKIDSALGIHVRRINKNMMRSAYLNKGSLTYKIYSFFENIIITMELARDGVTVAGLFLFIAFGCLIVTIVVASLLGMNLFISISIL